MSYVQRFLLTAIVTFAGCANTQMQSSWKDPQYAFPQLQSILVIGVTPTDTTQRSVEDAFTKEFAKRGARGVTSYSVSPGKLEQASVERILQENQIQGVLIARLIDKKTVEREMPPTTSVVPTGNSYNYSPVNQANPGFIPAGGNYANNNWYGYYANSYSVVTQPGYTIKEEFAVVETKLYDTASKKLIWAGTSNTAIGGTTDALIRDYARVVSQAIYK